MSKQLIVGIDLGGTSIKGMLATETGEEMQYLKKPTLRAEGPDQVITRLVEVIKGLISERPLSMIKGIGLGIPGAVDQVRGAVLYAPNLNWRNVLVKERLEQEFRLPVIMENDANTAALGEYYFGAGQGVRHMVQVIVGTGVGGGIIIDGKLYRGTTGYAGELGHMVIDPGGPECSCGNRGCLESLVAGPFVASCGVKLLQEHPDQDLLADVGGNPAALTTENILSACLAGNPLAEEIIDRVIHYLSIGFANIINILNPERVVLGGGFGEALASYVPRIEGKVKQMVLQGAWEGTRILPAKLGNRAGMLGAVALVKSGGK